MPDRSIAIADTSVLIAFEKLNILDKVCQIYEEIVLTEAVHQEFGSHIYECFTLAKAPEELTH